MGRSDKKGSASTPATEKTVPVAAATRAPMPSPKNPTPAPPKGDGIPRTTTDNPWRDLHPTRIWPD